MCIIASPSGPPMKTAASPLKSEISPKAWSFPSFYWEEMPKKPCHFERGQSPSREIFLAKSYLHAPNGLVEMTVFNTLEKSAPEGADFLSVSKKWSLRGSAHTAVAIPEDFRTVFDAFFL